MKNTILGIFLLATISWGFYKLVVYLLGFFIGLPKEIMAPIIAGFFAVIASLITVTLSKYIERKSIIDQEQRLRKAPIYQELITFILKLVPDKRGNPLSADDQIEFLKKFTETVMLWGSNEVIKEWSIFKSALTRQGIEPDNVKTQQSSLFLLENVLIAIRKDMGHKSSGMKRGDILRLFINDIDNYV